MMEVEKNNSKGTKCSNYWVKYRSGYSAAMRNVRDTWCQPQLLLMNKENESEDWRKTQKIQNH